MAKTTFNDGNKSLGILGTRVLAAFLNKIFNHRHTGIDDDGHSILDYAATTGSANAYILTLSPALESLVQGMPIFFKANFANTGACTLNINGLGAVALKIVSGDPPAGHIASGAIVQVVYDGTYFQIISVSCHPIRGCELNMTGEFEGHGAASLSIDLGAVKTGDRVWLEAQASISAATAGTISQLHAEVMFGAEYAHVRSVNTPSGEDGAYSVYSQCVIQTNGIGSIHSSYMFKVATDGNLIITLGVTGSAGCTRAINAHGFFFKKA